MFVVYSSDFFLSKNQKKFNGIINSININRILIQYNLKSNQNRCLTCSIEIFL